MGSGEGKRGARASQSAIPWSPGALNTAQDLLLNHLVNFFKTPKNFNTLRAIATPRTSSDNIKGKKRRKRGGARCDGGDVANDGENSQLSLRILDWLVTNFSRKQRVRYVVPGERTPFDVHISYLAMLNQFSKRNFDPFARRDKVVIEHDGVKIQTTAAQLNFFFWGIRNGVIDYAKDHIEEIREDLPRPTKRDSGAKLEESDNGQGKPLGAKKRARQPKGPGEVPVLDIVREPKGGLSVSFGGG